MDTALLDAIDTAVAARKPQRHGNEVTFICPAHDDHDPSARWNRMKAVWHCDACGAGGGAMDLARRLGIETQHDELPGLSLRDLAEAKGLPVEFLRSLSVKDGVSGTDRSPCVDIPYLDRTAELKAVRKRVRLAGKPRFFWRRGDHVMPYGLWRLDEMSDKTHLIVVEGESDPWTLWFTDFNGFGVPGADTWKEAWKPYVQDFETIYVWREMDTGGDSLSARVATDLSDVRVIEAPADAKDPNELWLRCGLDIDIFRERMQDLMTAARPASQIRAEALSTEGRKLFEQCRPLLEAPDLMERIKQAIHDGGYAGDLGTPMLVYVSLTSRVLERPLNLGVIAQSSAGKNRAVDSALALVPPESYHLIKAGSARALIYADVDYEHLMVIFAEADSIPSEGPAASAIRSLAADSVMSYDVVEKDPKTGQFATRHIEKPGPTGLITTSTTPLDEQMSTRLLQTAVADSQDQTRAVLRAHAASVNGLALTPDVADFIALQRWLEIAGDHRVSIPFGSVLADAVPARMVRMRRDFRQLLTVIQAIALLHQRRRQRDASGWIIAQFEDYELAYDLLIDVFTATASGGITDLIRRTVAAVASLISGSKGVTIKALGDYLGLHKDTAWHRVKQAQRLGVLVNQETRKGRPASIVLGDPMPENKPALPTVDELRCMCEEHPENDSTVQPPPAEPMSAESEPPVEPAVESAIQPEIQPRQTTLSDSPAGELEVTVERLNAESPAEHTQHDEGDRVYLGALAQALEFPQLQVRPGETILGGQDNWKLFLHRASAAQVSAALRALEAVSDLGPNTDREGA